MEPHSTSTGLVELDLSVKMARGSGRMGNSSLSAVGHTVSLLTSDNVELCHMLDQPLFEVIANGCVPRYGVQVRTVIRSELY